MRPLPVLALCCWKAAEATVARKSEPRSNHALPEATCMTSARPPTAIGAPLQRIYVAILESTAGCAPTNCSMQVLGKSARQYRH